MFFIVEGRDGKDPEAQQRRQAVRPDHLALIGELAKAGIVRFAAGYADSDGNLNGSMIVFEVESEQDIHDYLDKEPYVAGDVWQAVSIQPCKVPPIFLE